MDIVIKKIKKMINSIMVNELGKKSFLIKNNKVEKLRNIGRIGIVLNELNKDKLNSLLRLGLIRSEEMSNIELRRFKENQNNYNRNYNELERENVGMSNSKIWS